MPGWSNSCRRISRCSGNEPDDGAGLLRARRIRVAHTTVARWIDKNGAA